MSFSEIVLIRTVAHQQDYLQCNCSYVIKRLAQAVARRHVAVLKVITHSIKSFISPRFCSVLRADIGNVWDSYIMPFPRATYGKLVTMVGQHRDLASHTIRAYRQPRFGPALQLSGHSQ